LRFDSFQKLRRRSKTWEKRKNLVPPTVGKSPLRLLWKTRENKVQKHNHQAFSSIIALYANKSMYILINLMFLRNFHFFNFDGLKEREKLKT
jgi:hypothetical protein